MVVVERESFSPSKERKKKRLRKKLQNTHTKQNISARLPRVAVAWVRNYLAELALYFGVGGKKRMERERERKRRRNDGKKNPSLKPFQKKKKNSSGVWVYYIYFVFGSSLFPGSFNKEKDGLSMPPRSAVLEQIKVASKAMPLYALLPSLVENLAERGVTASFSRIDRDVGGIVPYLLLITAYMSFVEWGVYWVHRGLHDWKTGYR